MIHSRPMMFGFIFLFFSPYWTLDTISNQGRNRRSTPNITPSNLEDGLYHSFLVYGFTHYKFQIWDKIGSELKRWMALVQKNRSSTPFASSAEVSVTHPCRLCIDAPGTVGI